MQNIYQRYFLWIVLCLGFCASMADAQNHVLSLDGDGDYVEVVNSATLNPSAITLEAWVNPMSGGNIVAKGANNGYRFRVNQWQTVTFFDRGATNELSGNTLVPLNQWTHIAVVGDDTGLKIYVNGVLDAIKSTPYGAPLTIDSLKIGSEPKFNEHFHGYLDEVRIWNKARTPEEILATMTISLTGQESGLVGYWTFEGTSEKVIDVTGNGHHGKLVGDTKRVLSELPNIPALLAALNAADVQGRVDAAGTLGRLDSEKRNLVIPILVQALGHPNAKVRFSAACNLDVIDNTHRDQVIPILIGALETPNEIERATMVWALSRMGSDAVPALIAALRDANDSVRQNAGWTLAELGESAAAATPALKQALKDSNEKVRRYAAWALAKRGESPEEAVPALIDALADESDEVRRDAVEAFGRMDAPPAAAVPALTKALAEKSDQVRVNAAQALGKIGSPATAAVPALIQTLSDKNESVRQRATWALKRIGLPESMENVYEVAEKAHTLLWLGILLAIGVVHLLLFLFYPKSINNLYYAIWVGNMVVVFGLGVIFFPVADNSPPHRAMFIIGLGIALSGLRFLYALFYTRLPKQFWVFLAVWVHLAVGLCLTPNLSSYNSLLQVFLVSLPLVLFLLAACVEMLRVLLMAILKKKDGAWMISIGFMAMIAVFIAWVVNSMTVDGRPLRFLEEEEVLEAVRTLAIIGLLVSVSTYLARNFARTNKALEAAKESLETKNTQLTAAHEHILALNEQLQDENLRMSAELSVTEKIQRLILPTPEELKAVLYLDIAGYMAPAHEVGGDYYDVLQQDGRLTIAIGDVTGHGVESGMVMLMTQSVVRALLQSGETDPVRFLDTLNRTIYQNVQRMESDKNLTLCLLDYAEGEVKLSGQHEEMIVVRRDGTVERIDTMDLGFPIGLENEIAEFIDQTTVQLAPGDGVVLYTDGVTEAENRSREQYGLERLCEVVSRHWLQSAEGIKDAVVADVRGFIGEGEIYDDITLLVLKQK